MNFKLARTSIEHIDNKRSK